MNKQILIILAIVLVSFQSCKSQSENNYADPSAVSVPENISMIQASDVEVLAAPVNITKSDFLANVMNYEENTQMWVYEGELPCIVDFYATWCPPCKISDPILEELAAEYADKIKIFKVDVDKEQELAAVFGVQSIPTFLFCPMEGNPTISSGIAQTEEDTRSMFIQQIEEILLNSTLSSL